MVQHAFTVRKAEGARLARQLTASLRLQKHRVALTLWEMWSQGTQHDEEYNVPYTVGLFINANSIIGKMIIACCYAHINVCVSMWVCTVCALVLVSAYLLQCVCACLCVRVAMCTKKKHYCKQSKSIYMQIRFWLNGLGCLMGWVPWWNGASHKLSKKVMNLSILKQHFSMGV